MKSMSSKSYGTRNNPITDLWNPAFKDINVHTIQASIIIDRAGRLKAVFYGALFPL